MIQAIFYSSPGDVGRWPTLPDANHVWVVEQFFNNRWEPVGAFVTQDEETGEDVLELGVGAKREYARDVARKIRQRGREVRVMPYLSRGDSKRRVNRQVNNERLDY